MAQLWHVRLVARMLQAQWWRRTATRTVALRRQQENTALEKDTAACETPLDGNDNEDPSFNLVGLTLT